MSDLASADVIVEAVFEDLDVKRKVFGALDAHAKPGAILASNTSTLNIDTIAGCHAAARGRARPAFLQPGTAHAPDRDRARAGDGARGACECLALAKTLGKVGVVAGVCDGFIGNRMLRPYLRQAELLLLEGCLPHEVDGALERWGWAMGPCRMQDLAGNDVGASIRHRHYALQPGAPRSYIADRLAELQRFGQKSGRGYYRYEADCRRALPDTAVAAIILEVARTRGVTRRHIGDEEIVTRCVYALINEGARVLEEGIAARAADIDVVYLLGYGFPAVRGGPMFHADRVGLALIVQAMQRFAASAIGEPGLWTPAPLLARLAATGRTFGA